MTESDDPRVADDVPLPQLYITQGVLRLLGLVGARRILSRMFPAPSISHFDVKKHPRVEGYVALTLDDAFHSGARPEASMLPEVRDLLGQYEARATFFVMLDGCHEVPDEALRSLIDAGHEFGNHLITDRPYHEDSEQDFEKALLEAQTKLAEWSDEKPRWFRAPHGKLSPTMLRVLARHGLTNAMMDAYAHDPFVPDAGFVSKFMVDQATHGSIMLIHMPERGFREWNFAALAEVLRRLRAKGLTPVTLSELADRAGPVQT